MGDDASPSGKKRRPKKGNLTLKTVKGDLPPPDENTAVTVVNLTSKETKVGSKKRLKVKEKKLSQKEQEAVLADLLGQEEKKKGKKGKSKKPKVDPTGGLKKVRKVNEKKIAEKEFELVTEKTKWKCIRCGWCCSQSWRVNLTWKEYDRLKDVLPIDNVVVDEKSGFSHPLMEIRGKCVCLSDKNLCTIRANWPYTCAVYPFNLTMDGQLIHSVHCKGLGHGKVVDIKKWTKRVYKERRKAGMPVPDDYE